MPSCRAVLCGANDMCLLAASVGPCGVENRVDEDWWLAGWRGAVAGYGCRLHFGVVSSFPLMFVFMKAPGRVLPALVM